MNRLRLANLVALGEGFTTEFKRSMPSDLGREICAFANAGGGVSEAGGGAGRGGGEGVEGADVDEPVQRAAAVFGGCAGGVVGVEFGGGEWALRQGSAQLLAAFPKHLGGTESIHES